VQYVGKIDRNLYKVITKDITTDEVVITDNQIQHIKERHPNDYERYSSYIPEIIGNPDYILEDKNPNTALILKEITDTDVNERFQLILRLHTSNDVQGRKNSVITYLNINKSRYEQYLRNKKILYSVDKKE